MSAFDKIRAMHPDARSIWTECLGGWLRFTVDDRVAGAVVYSQIEGSWVFKNEASGELLGV